MIRLIWNISVLIHGALRYAPTNLMAAAVRRPRGMKWGWAAMLLAPGYFLAAGVMLELVHRDAPQWLVLASAVMLWNGFKMLWIGPISVVLLARNHIQRAQASHTL